MTESEFLAAIAKSRTKANRAAKSVTTDQLEKAISNLQGALKTAKTLEKSKEAKKRESNIKKLSAMMAGMGLTPSDLSGTKKARVSKKARSKSGARKASKVPPKYELKANGTTVQWTGRGRMPVAFREFVESGGSLEKCLIKA